MIDELYNLIEEAKNKLLLQGIEANMILISPHLAYSIIQLPDKDIPVICGLKTLVQYDMPKDVDFMVTHSDNLPDTKDEKIEKLKCKNAELKQIISDIKRVCDEAT